ncbi:MAG: TolC family protein [Bacteroidetes bacterium]|uniref:TolC family protein n=1 Tax=Candidatus Cryptobacteroides intestinigallinarum TaxID=2840767 RepID=A0A9D9HKG3_9BACT|nr:TolC family protein [Candidatus Cryptobacteroides intestinigallinarum]
MEKTNKQVIIRNKAALRLCSLAAALLCCPALMQAQITIEQCMSLARDNYPQIKQLNLIEESARYDISAISKSWLPHINISGKATYQSDVVEMPFDIPGFTFNLPHDQYSLVGEISQTIWDGGTAKSQKQISNAGAEVQKNQVEVSVYSINDRVAKIYLGILLIDSQLRQNEILEDRLERNASQAQAGIDNGVAYKSDLDMIKVNILNCEQQKEGLMTDRKAYVAMLEKLIGRSLDGQELVIPDETYGALQTEITRPELDLYQAQMLQNEAQVRQLDAKISPKFSLSLQGGVGRPGLNILKNSFQPYYTAGIKMSWDIGALYTRKNDKQKLDAQLRTIESDKETFLFNTKLNATQMSGEIEKARNLLEKDKEIIALQESIRAAGEEQYRNGTISMTDLMDRIGDEHDAKVAESIHTIQLLMAIYDLKNCIGYGDMHANETTQNTLTK